MSDGRLACAWVYGHNDYVQVVTIGTVETATTFHGYVTQTDEYGIALMKAYQPRLYGGYTRFNVYLPWTSVLYVQPIPVPEED